MFYLWGLIFFSFIFFVPKISHATNYYYTTETAFGSATGSYTSLALDSNNDPNISFRREGPSGKLHYAIKSSGVWTIEAVDTSAYGSETSIAIDNSDNVYISYYYSYNSLQDLKVATKPSGGSWSNVTVDSTGNVGHYSSIALNGADLGVSYYDQTNGDLKLATKPSAGSWSTATVDSTDVVGLDTSLAYDSSGNYHISYYDSTNQTLEYLVEGQSPETVASVGSQTGDKKTSIVIDSLGNPHISFFNSTNGDLMYATKSGTWTVEAVATSGTQGAFSSIDLDSNGNPVISYRGGGSGNLGLAVARYNGSSWEIDQVSTSNHGAYTSLVVDGNDNIHISSSDNSSSGLLYTFGEPGNVVDGLNTNVDVWFGPNTYTGSDTAGGITIDNISLTGDGRIRHSAYGGSDSDFEVASFVGDVYDTMELTLDDATLNGTATLTFNYGTTAILNALAAAGLTEEDIRIFHITGGSTVEQLPIVSLDTVNNTIQVTTTSFSPFAFGVNPEPTTLFLLASALLGLLPLRRKH